MINLGAQLDGFTITGSAHADTITGGQGADMINAGAEADIIVGFISGDTVDGGDGERHADARRDLGRPQRGAATTTWSMSRSSRRRRPRPG